ncbi:MAG TPA: hypothetical protein VGK35_13915, partial [Actinotalea sp.]
MLRLNRTRGRLPRVVTLTAAAAVLALGAAATPAGAASGSPLGAVESVTAVSGGVRVTGWAWDGDTTAAVTMSLTAGTVAVKAPASGYRADIAKLYPAAGSYRGFDVVVPTAPGSQSVCTTALNVGAGSNKAFGCTTVTVPNSSPVGNTDGVTVTATGVRIWGWAADPDMTAPITVRLAFAGTTRDVVANLPRPDVQKAYPTYGGYTGWDSTIALAPGSYQVCPTLLNVGPGSDRKFTCRAVTIADHSPTGSLDGVAEAAGGLQVRGWATDPDTTAPLSVRLAVTGTSVAQTVTADRVVSGQATASGFDTVLPLTPGTYEVCATAVNVSVGTDKALGCATGTVLDHNPSGALQSATDSAAGGLEVDGWASDIDATTGVSVRLAVTGTAVSATVAADTVSTTSLTASALPTAFSTVLALAPGTYQVCGTAVNVGLGADQALGCTTGTVKDHSPVGSLDSALAVSTGVRVQGFAADPDTTSPLSVRVTVGGTTTTLAAGVSRSDVPYTYPWAGGSTGFDGVIALSAGTYQVCATAVNSGLGTDKALGCTSVTIAAPAPAPSTLPGPTNTGVPAGTTLTVWNGDYTVTTPGAVISNLDIRGYLRIKADNVTVKNTIVRGRDGLTTSMSLVQSTQVGVKIIDTELVAAYPSYWIDGFVGNNVTFTRVNVH